MRIFLISIFLLNLFGERLEAQTIKNLNDFKNKISSLQRTALSLYNNQTYIGEIVAYVNEKNELVSIDFKSFEKLMKAFLLEDKFQDFHSRFMSKSILTKDELNLYGFELILDSNNFKLDLRTSEMFLKPTVLSINTYTVDGNEINERDALVSGFLNYSVNATERFENNKNSSTSLDGSFSGNINFNTINLESHHVYSDKDRWSRTGSRLTKDFQSAGLRMSLGDQSYAPQTFQSGYQYLGLRIKKEFELSPFEIKDARAEREIYLDTPSVVEIYVNGLMVQTLNLEAGKHKLEDIPINQGINHVVVRISDNAGKKKYIEFKHIGSDQLLKPGIHEYEYNIGSISKLGKNDFSYTNDAVISGFHKYGMNSQWTIGAQGQFKNGFFVFGPENEIATERGLFVHNVATSQAKNGNRGLATSLSYFWSCPCGDGDQVKRLVLSYEYKTDRFLTNIFTETYSNRDSRNTLFASYNQKISNDLSGIISASIYTSDFASFSKRQYALGLNQSFNNDLFLVSSLQLLKSNKSYENNTLSFLVQLNYSFDFGHKNLVASSNKNNQNIVNQLEFTHNKNTPVNNEIYRARVYKAENNNNGALGYYMNTQNIELSSSAEMMSENGVKVLSINPSGSIAFANKSLAFGQKIQNSFVLISNDQKEPMIVNGDSDSYEAYLKPNSSAILTSAQPYVPKSINVISDAKDSLGLSNKGYRTQSTYRAGSLLKLGGELKKMAEGILVNSKSEPYSFIGGKIVNLSNGKEVQFFTGKNGKFFLENLSNDSFQIIIYDKKTVKVFNIDLKEKLKDERNDLGKIIID